MASLALAIAVSFPIAARAQDVAGEEAEAVTEPLAVDAQPSEGPAVPSVAAEDDPPAPVDVPEAPAASDDPPSSLPAVETSAGDIEVGFSGSDGAYIRTHDRAWALRIGLLFQLRAAFSSTPDPAREVEFVPVLARMYLQGAVAQPWIRYFAQLEFAGQQNPYPAAPVAEAPRLLDFWMEAQPHEAFGVRIGVMRPPMSRSWITGLQRMALFDRTDANLFFRNHGATVGGSMGGTTPVVPWDRDIGVLVYGTPAGGLFEYYAGVYNGNGFLFGRNEADAVMPLVRLAVSPLGAVSYDETPALANPHLPFRFQVGVSGYYNHYRAFYTDTMMAQQVGTEEQYTLEGDAMAQFESFYLATEVYYRNRRVVDGTRHDEAGAMGIASWMFLHPYLEAVLRFSVIDPNLSNAADFRQVYDVGINAYAAGNNVRFGLRYTASSNDTTFPGGSPGAPFTVPAGIWIHTVGIWSQLYF